MKIIFVCNEYPPMAHGGIGTFTRVAASALVRAGHSVRVLGYGTGSLAETSLDGGVEIVRVPALDFDQMGIRARLRLFSIVARWCREWNPDVVEVPDAEGWAAGWRKLPIPLVSRVHGSITYFASEMHKPRNMNQHIAYLFERGSLRRSDFWCSVSKYAALKTQGLFGLKDCAGVQHNPIDVSEMPLRRRRRNMVVYTGTLTEKKGVIQLMRAWPHVLKTNPTAELHIAGRGDELRRKMIEQLDTASRASVHFHGNLPRDKVLEMLREARVAVFPSYAEAFALAPMEAMSTGCPTIYSFRSSGPELIEHGVHGLLVDPDRPPEIAAAIVKILADDALAVRLGEAGRERVLWTFAPDQWVLTVEAFYQSCKDAFHRQHGLRSAGVAAGHD